MLNAILRRLILLFRDKAGIDKTLLLLGGVRSHQNQRVEKFDTLRDAEFSVYSQWGEDGIIDFLVGAIPVKENIFIEIGTEDYSEANTRFLLMHRYWRGLIVDGSDANMAAVNRSSIAYKFDLRTRAGFVTRDNVRELISLDGFNERAGLLSIDIDGVDYWVLEAIPDRPEIVIVEYNDLFDPAAVTVPYDPGFVRREKHYSNLYWGASLAAFDFLLKARGYTFAGSNGAGTNAFFVRDDVADRVTRRLHRIAAWPSRMREARDSAGRLVLEDRRKLLDQIAHLSLVRVDTGETVKVGDVITADARGQ